MKLAALLAAALLLIGCPGNSAQNAPTPPQGGLGRPETPGMPKDVSAAPRPAPETLTGETRPAAVIHPTGVVGYSQGRAGAPSAGVAQSAEHSVNGERVGAIPTPGLGVANIGTAAGAIRGTARWFSTGPNGVAAAGPRLRAALGSHWRGTLVGVTYRGRTVWARLSDWCACGSGSIIDLPDELFRRLAPLSTGVLSVTVHWGDRNVLPATDTAGTR